MKHNLKINVSKDSQACGIVSCRSITIRDRLLKLLFGDKHKITVLIPGDSVDELTICEKKEGGTKDERGQTNE